MNRPNRSIVVLSVSLFPALVAPDAAAQRTLFESAGGAAGDRHGHAVAVLDDLNGDGVRDVVVGAPGADPSGLESGAALVLSGADGTVLLALAGAAAGDSFGRDVADAGDVDGDGVGDVVVAAHGPAGAPGYARVFSGATGAVLHSFVGAHAGDRFHSVAGGGDVDLDGVPDLVLGTPNHNAGGAAAGRVVVHSGANGAVVHSILGSPGIQLGVAVDFAGEIDGDGRDDFAAGALLDTVGGPQAGSVQVFSGGTGALIRRFDGAPSDRLGIAVDRAGDVDLDGVTDLVAGAQQPSLGGYAEVFSGLGGSVLKIAETVKFQGFGFAVAGAGDVDGDGFDDLVVGVPNFDGTFEDQGAARVFLSPGGDLRSTVVGTHPGDRVGTAVEGGFDGDADGLSDVVIGAPFFADPAPESGRAIAWSIRGGGPALATFGQPPGATWYGLDVAGVGDVDQDGTPDLAVGSIWDSTGALNAGSAWIHSGATGQLLHQFSGDSAHDHLSESIAGAGDVDQDGFADVITGAPNDDNTVFNAGSARVHSGRTGAPLHTFDGSGTQHAFGWSVDGAGDVDGDGFDDVLVGAFAGNEARLHSGRTGALLAQWTGSSGSRFGSAVAGVGDVNGDGFPDALVGAPLASEGSSVNGGAYVFSGAGAGLLRSHGGTFPNDWLGASVAGLGDADGDGFSDYAVGASTNATGGVGYARFFSGTTGNVLHSVYGDASETNLGAGVGPAGDWDGDGRDDALVGARAGGPLGAGQVEVVSPATGAILETFSGPGSSAAFGSGLDHLGDVDGDGRPEIVVGASGGAHVLGRPCAPAEHYGLGCPGTGGHVPRLVVSGCASAGFSVTLGLFDALGGTNALLLFGAQKAQLPAFGACDLLVSPLLSAGVALPLPGAGAAAGTFVAAGTLPPSTSGLTVAAQAFVADPGAPAGVAATNGVLLSP